jgi:hypothetical protein
MSDEQPSTDSSATVVRNLKVKVRHVDMRRLAEDEACERAGGEVVRKVIPRPQAVPAGPAPDSSEILNRR